MFYEFFSIQPIEFFKNILPSVPPPDPFSVGDNPRFSRDCTTIFNAEFSLSKEYFSNNISDFKFIFDSSNSFWVSSTAMDNVWLCLIHVFLAFY